MPGFDDELTDALHSSAPAVGGDGVFERVVAKRARRRRNRRVLLPGGAVAIAGLLVAVLLMGADDGRVTVDTRSRRPAALDEPTVPEQPTTTIEAPIFQSAASGPCAPGTGAGFQRHPMAATPVAMVDPSRAWVAAGSNIYATTDGGATWAHQADCPGFFIADLAFVDALHGWALNTSAALARTSDGGQTWVTQTLPHPQTNWIMIAFLDADHGWIAGHQGMATTSDGGQTWRVLPSPTGGIPQRLVFTDPLHGWAAFWGLPSKRTADGGATWAPMGPDSGGSYGVHFVDNSTGWTASGSTVYRTDDGGLTWTAGRMPSTRGYLFDVFFVDRLHGWAVGVTNSEDGSPGAIVATTDGGATWSQQDAGPSVGMLHHVRFVDVDHGLATADGGTIRRTSDGGKTWQ